MLTDLMDVLKQIEAHQQRLLKKAQSQKEEVGVHWCQLHPAGSLAVVDLDCEAHHHQHNNGALHACFQHDPHKVWSAAFRH